MKRYDLEDTGTPGEPWNQMIEDPQGEWVRYEEVRVLIETKPPNIELAECNCKDHVPPFGKIKEYWICPTHGYKFLGIPLERG